MLRVEKYASRHSRDIPEIRTLLLPFEVRQKSRFRAVLEDGTEAAIFLPRGSILTDGVLLQADDGTLIKVVAAPEHVLYVTAPSFHALMRAAYHLGNRHTPVELGNGFLKLENDSVLKQMLLGLDLVVREDHLPFQPEQGAYGGGHRHDADSGEERAHAQKLFHAHYDSHHSEDAREQQSHTHDEPRTSEICKLTTLLQLASPALPIGGFSYSQGLEAAVDAKIVHDVATAHDWIEEGLRHVLAVNELPMLAILYRCWEFNDFSEVQKLNAMFLASRETSELRQETEQMGWSLSQLSQGLGWNDETQRSQLTKLKPIGLPTAFAFAATGLGIDRGSAVAAYAFNWVENQVAAALKAVPLGQMAGQKILFAMHAFIPEVVYRAVATKPDEICTFAPNLGILAARHENQYSRLFRS